jgi:hypothetical protein
MELFDHLFTHSFSDISTTSIVRACGFYGSYCLIFTCLHDQDNDSLTNPCNNTKKQGDQLKTILYRQPNLSYVEPTRNMADESQRPQEEKRAYNRLVSARARQKTKQTIASLEATVETQSKRLLELEQMRSVLSEQVRLIAAEKAKAELALLQERSRDGIATNDLQGLTNPGGCFLPLAASNAINASLATNSDANAWLLDALSSATPCRTSAVSLPPPMFGSPQAATLSAARATTISDSMQRQLNELVADSSMNALLLGNANNTTSIYRLTPHPAPIIAPPPPPPRGSTTLLHGGTTSTRAASRQQPTASLSPPPHQAELLAILQLLQMNRDARGRSTNS